MFGWNWELLGMVPPIMMGIMMLVLLYGVNVMRKTNNKFLAFVYLLLAVALGIALYAIYGKKIFG